MTLGEKIQELRKVSGLSQEALAEKMDISRQAISKWETDLSKPSTQNLIHLAAIFNVRVEQLAHPNMHVELVMDVGKEIATMKKNKMPYIIWAAIALMLFASTFALALYGRIKGGVDEQTVLVLVIISACSILSAILPVIISIMRFVYHDCKKRMLKPTFWVLISCTFLGLGYYLIKRDSLTS